MFIYLITNKVNGKQYVGQTVNCIYRRLREHTAPSNPEIIGKVAKKYGKKNLEVVLLDTATSMEELNAKEIFWIKELDSYNKGYNCNLGGDGQLGLIQSDETKARLSQANGGRDFEAWKDGELVGVYSYVSKACEELGIGSNASISNCLRGEQYETQEGYRFKHVGENFKKKSKGDWFKDFEVWKNGELVGIWNNKAKCERELNLPNGGIKDCLNGRNNHCKGYNIKYVGKGFAYVPKENKGHSKEVHCITNGITYKSATHAGKQLGISFGSVARVARGERPQTKGYKFIYKKDLQNIK